MAAYTLFDIVYRVLRELGAIIEGMATGGSTTTIVDSVHLQTHFVDDYFNGGYAFILYDAGGAGAAPQGEWGRITDFVAASGTVTFTPAMTVAVAANDRFGLSTAKFTRDQVISAVNQVLAEIPIEFHDDSTITTADGKTEYTLPAAILDLGIEVWVNRDDEADDNYWLKLHDWYVEEDPTGTAKKLIFRNQPITPCHIRIKYYLPHAPIYLSSDKLRESVDINRVVLAAAYRLLNWQKGQPGVNEPELDKRAAEIYLRLEAARWRSPARKGYPKLNTLGIIDNEVA